ncbi:MAG: hypothetical protein H7331_04205 [Bacteroidia bacterium]|nr:hypothetical protein [Bacteroidia bacterium]
MKAVSLSELKKELNQLEPHKLIELAITLAKYKKDNKEFLSYLLFDEHNKHQFISDFKKEIDLYFAEINISGNLNNTKKTLRKILRIITKYCKYANDKAITVDLHIYFCSTLKASSIPYYKSQMICNMYALQLKKINTLIGTLHEDIQQDFTPDLEKISM